jgi:hypothetical protein
VSRKKGIFGVAPCQKRCLCALVIGDRRVKLTSMGSYGMVHVEDEKSEIVICRDALAPVMRLFFMPVSPDCLPLSA